MPPAIAVRRRSVELPDLVPARMLNEFVYCPRLFFYEWVEGVFRHNADTVDGAQKHEKGDEKEDALPAPDEIEGEVFKARGVMLSSERLGLIAKMDMVEAANGAVTPVDYKRGKPRDGDDGPEAWPADQAQIAAQVLVLRDNGYVADEGLLFYYETRQRVRVPVTPELVAQIEGQLQSARDLARSGRIPPPLVDSPKCPRCSLVDICLPDETAAAAGLSPTADEPEQFVLFEDLPGPTGVTDLNAADVRRLVPARDDLRPLYITGYQLSVGKSGERLQVKEKGKVIQ